LSIVYIAFNPQQEEFLQGRSVEDLSAKELIEYGKLTSPTKRLNTPLKRRPPTKEELIALEEEYGDEVGNFLPGYNEYRKKINDESNKPWALRAKIAAARAAGVRPDWLKEEYNEYKYSPENLKGVHLPGTVPTSDEERSSIYDDSREMLGKAMWTNKFDLEMTNKIDTLIKKGYSDDQIREVIDPIVKKKWESQMLKLAKAGNINSTNPKEIAHIIAEDSAKTGLPAREHIDSVLFNMQYKNPYKN